MRNCKEISKLVSDSLERELRLTERIELWIHLMMCRLCRLFRSNVQAIQSVAKTLASDINDPSPGLSMEAKQRIAAAIRAARSDKNQ